MGIDYEEFTVHPGEAKHVREMAEQVYGHTSQMGVDHKEYAETGTWYYKSAAVSQRLIGVGAVLQALALVGILAILYFKL